MSRLIRSIPLLLLLWAAVHPAAGAEAARFAVLDVYLDAGNEPLAAWQFELAAADGGLQIVGIENGGHPAFPAAPYYDRQAVERDRPDRIVVADYSLRPAQELPVGRTRLCRVHVRIEGDAEPRIELRLIAAGNPAGEAVSAHITWEAS